MKFGVVRNVAGNIQALQNADKQFDDLGVDTKICLGQVVGIYPYVDDCICLLTNKKYSVLRQLIDEEFVAGCHFAGWSKTYLVDAVKFAYGLTSSDAIHFIKALPRSIEIAGVGLEGLAPGDSYLHHPTQVSVAFTTWRQSVVIHAAESDPYVWREDLSRIPLETGINQLVKTGRLLISSGGLGSFYEGSVNTGEPAAIIYDDHYKTVQVLRPTCNLEKIFNDLRTTNYPRQSLNFLERREYRAWRGQRT